MLQSFWMTTYIYCQGLRTLKEQQLDRFCTAWEDLKWERDAFAKEINRRDCCGEGYTLTRRWQKKWDLENIGDQNDEKLFNKCIMINNRIIKLSHCLNYWSVNAPGRSARSRPLAAARLGTCAAHTRRWIVTFTMGMLGISIIYTSYQTHEPEVYDKNNNVCY